MTAWYAADVGGLPVYVVLWLFLLYSCAGVLVEGLFCFVVHRRLELRLGLLYLPLRPIYGLGGAGCTVLLTPLLDRPVIVFALSAVICSAVEFVAGWAVERLFGTISWDYSDKWLNLRGRVCLQYSLCWGLLATAALYVLQPLVAEVVGQPAPRPGETLLTVLLVLMLLSAVLTLAALHRARRRVDAVRARTQGESTTSSDTTWDRLIARLVPDPVLIVSFPRMGLSAELRELNRDRRTTGTRSSTTPAHASRNRVDASSLRRHAVRGDLQRPVRR